MLRCTKTSVFPILIAISISHLLNNSMPSLIPAIYPLDQGQFPPELLADRSDNLHE